MTRPAGPGGGPTVHLVRHGQSTWNLQHRVQGQRTEPDLTDLGRLQAIEVARALAGVTPVLLLTSDLTRAVHTADVIGSALRREPIPTPLLREQALGELEGLTTAEASARLAGVDLADPAVRYAGGESRLDVAASELAPTDEIVLVSHGDTIRIAIALLLGEDQADAPWRPIDNGSVTTVIARFVTDQGCPSVPMAAAPATSSGPRDR